MSDISKGVTGALKSALDALNALRKARDSILGRKADEPASAPTPAAGSKFNQADQDKTHAYEQELARNYAADLEKRIASAGASKEEKAFYRERLQDHRDKYGNVLINPGSPGGSNITIENPGSAGVDQKPLPGKPAGVDVPNVPHTGHSKPAPQSDPIIGTPSTPQGGPNVMAQGDNSREVGAKDGTLPEKAFDSKAPNQVTPGTRVLEGQHINNQGRVEPWKAYYDQYGRQIGRTDYNAGNKSQGIPDTHSHTYEYGPGKNKVEVDKHKPGEYK